MRSDVSQNLQKKLLVNLRRRSTLCDLCFLSYGQNKNEQKRNAVTLCP